MYSRAHLLIERDHEKLVKENLWGIEVHPVKEDNYFEWTAKICGLKGTVWEGGVFRLYLKFDEHYNSTPPNVCFHTIPFHPNVDVITGRPCMDFLDDPQKWNDSYSMGHVLLSIQNLLSNPVLSEPVNTDAANMLMYSPHSYKQIVQDCVAASQRLEAGTNSHQSGEKISFVPADNKPAKATTPKTSNVKVAKLSFEDYLRTWSGIATSKSSADVKNPLLEAIREQPSLQTAHYGLPVEELQQQVDRQIKEHNELIYGRFRAKASDDKQAKLDQVNKMRKIYLQPRKTPPSTPNHWRGRTDMSMTLHSHQAAEEPWEREVDDLVAWTNNLDEDNL